MGQSDFKNIQVNSLTSLRFFAIMIVVVHHLKELIGWAPSGGWGAVGVSFFFVLSGFVLTLNYQKILTYNDAGNFLWRRFVRLYPLYIVTLFISIFVIQFYKIKLDTGLVSTVANLLLLQSWFSASEIHFAFNSVSWAISTLVFFYIAFVFIQFNFLKNFLIITLLSLVSLVMSVIYIITNNSEPIQIHWLLHMIPTNRILVFLIGMILGKIFLSVRDGVNNLNILTASFFELLSILLIIDRLSSCIVLNTMLRVLHKYIDVPQPLARQIIDIYFLTPVLCGLLIFICSLQFGLISRFLSSKLLVFLGELSFAIYLSHQLVFRLLSGVKFLPAIPLTLLALFITIVASYLLFQFIEKPCAQHLKNYFQYQKT